MNSSFSYRRDLNRSVPGHDHPSLHSPQRSWLTRIRNAALVTLMGVGTILVNPGRAIAADFVTLEFAGEEVTVPISELEDLALRGVVSSTIQDFFDITEQDAPLIQELLSREVVVGSDVANFFETSTGEFVVLQLDRLISRSPSADTVEALRTALRTSYERDGRFSLIEIARAYPEREIYIDLRGAEQVYSDVKTFVERIQPVLDTARRYLQELICNCDEPATATLLDEPATDETGAAEAAPTESSLEPELDSELSEEPITDGEESSSTAFPVHLQSRTNEGPIDSACPTAEVSPL
jgi:hypothetical protein